MKIIKWLLNFSTKIAIFVNAKKIGVLFSVQGLWLGCEEKFFWKRKKKELGEYLMNSYSSVW